MNLNAYLNLLVDQDDSHCTVLLLYDMRIVFHFIKLYGTCNFSFAEPFVFFFQGFQEGRFTSIFWAKMKEDMAGLKIYDVQNLLLYEILFSTRKLEKSTREDSKFLAS